MIVRELPAGYTADVIDGALVISDDDGAKVAEVEPYNPSLAYIYDGGKVPPEVRAAEAARRQQDHNTRRGQAIFAYVAGTVGCVVMLAIAGRYVAGLFELMSALDFGEVWLGLGVGFVCMLGSAAFAQVAVGNIGAGILRLFKPGGAG